MRLRRDICRRCRELSDFDSVRAKEKYFRRLEGERKYDALNEIIEESAHIVFLGGAGVSTESGIPDFRSKNGLYKKRDSRFQKYKPEYLLSYSCLDKNPEVFFAYFRRNLDCRRVQPNDAHRKLAEMEMRGKLDGVITQNIDGLHQKVGSRKVCEIHGSALRSYCVRCNAQYGEDFIFESSDEVPRCPECGRMVRPDVTLYGEFLPQNAYEEAVSLIRYADCLIIGGTSLEVGSASQRYCSHLMYCPCHPERKRRIFYHLQRLYVKDPSLTLRMTPQLPQKQAILCGSVNSNHRNLRICITGNISSSSIKGKRRWREGRILFSMRAYRVF